MDEGKYYIKIKLMGLPSGGNSRQHWRDKYTEVSKWKSAILKAVGDNKPPSPLQKVKLRYTRSSSNTMDWDNVAISFKAVQDGLTEAGVIADDKIKNIPEMPIYDQVAGKRGKGYITIEVWEI